MVSPNRRWFPAWPATNVMLTAITRLFPVLLAAAMFSDDIAAADRYNVEVLVFENGAAGDAGEQWRPSMLPAPGPGALDPLDNRARITALDPKAMRLTGAARELRRSGRHRVLAHTAWQQPAFQRDKAKAVRINNAVQTIDGSVRLERGRYLHLFIDLEFLPRLGFSHTDAFRIIQSRRVRNQEIHYFDHPRFGVLAVVSRDHS